MFLTTSPKGPKGFRFREEVTAGSLRERMFALFTDDPRSLCDLLEPEKDTLTGFVVAWGSNVRIRRLGSCLWLVEVPRNVPYLRDLLKTHFSILKVHSLERESLARLEGDGAESERLYQELYENAFEGIFRVSREGRVLSANPAMVRILGFASEEELVEELTDIVRQLCVTSEDREEVARFLKDEGRLVGHELQVARKDGDVIWVALSARKVMADDCRLLYYEGSVVDITSKKDTEVAELSRKEAEAANRAKTQFLAVLSHEIRTPLNAILGMADLLWESQLTPEQKEYVQIYRQAGKMLENILDQVLDMSKAEAGRLELADKPFHLREALERAVESVAYEAHRKGLELVLDCASELPRGVRGDADRLVQILVNLLSNAVKFTHEGHVVLEAAPSSQVRNPGETGMELSFTVRDTGIGISLEQQQDIFEVFSQADSSRTRRFGGAGLGLSISKALIALMGGDIWVESSKGTGSIFFFTVWLSEVESQKEPRLGAFESASVLVADDHPLARRAMRNMLLDWRARVTEAASGKECLKAVETAREKSTPFDLILLDEDMPGMDGFSVLEELGKRYEHPQPVVMLLSIEGRSRKSAKAIWAGAWATLVKPVGRERLKNAGLGVLSAERDLDPARKERPLRILLVEDNENNRMLFSFFLKKTPHSLAEAKDGGEGYDLFRKKQFDLVFMDIEMPVMDGYETVAAIRAYEKEKGLDPVPIIALTANTMEDAHRSLEAGCTRHLTKPFRREQLLSLLGTCV